MNLMILLLLFLSNCAVRVYEKPKVSLFPNRVTLKAFDIKTNMSKSLISTIKTNTLNTNIIHPSTINLLNVQIKIGDCIDEIKLLSLTTNGTMISYSGFRWLKTLPALLEDACERIWYHHTKTLLSKNILESKQLLIKLQDCYFDENKKKCCISMIVSIDNKNIAIKKECDVILINQTIVECLNQALQFGYQNITHH